METTLPNIFTAETTSQLTERINKLNETSKPIWGKMSIAQMLAHCCVPYEMTFETKHPRPNALMKFIIKSLAKSTVVSTKPYPKSSRTAPQFIITDEREFTTEKERLTGYLNKAEGLGAQHFDQKESHSFGKLSIEEWNNLFYKHLDHHLKQFGV